MASTSNYRSSSTPAPDDASLQGIIKLTSNQLRFRLKRDGIIVNANALKPELQATWALHTLGALKAGEEPNQTLLNQVTEWCRASAGAVSVSAENAGLSKGRNKWHHIEALIRAGRQDVHKYFESDTYSDSGSDPSTSKEEEKPDHVESALNKLSIEAQPQAQHSHHEAVNLLITSIFAEIARPDKIPSASAATGFPKKGAANTLKHLNELPHFHSSQQLATALRLPRSESEELLAWICSSFGDILSPATGNMIIPGFAHTVHQFVVTKPIAKLKSAFDKHINKKSGESMLLFHGTPMIFMRSILRNGFRPSSDRTYGIGVFMAEQPQVSYPYSGGLTVGEGIYYGQSYHPNDKVWANNPYGGCGVLFGCEVVGEGRPAQGWPGVHVVSELGSILVRYVFLLPENDMLGQQGYPQREVVEAPMMAAFKRMRNAGVEE